MLLLFFTNLSHSSNSDTFCSSKLGPLCPSINGRRSISYPAYEQGEAQAALNRKILQRLKQLAKGLKGKDLEAQAAAAAKKSTVPVSTGTGNTEEEGAPRGLSTGGSNFQAHSRIRFKSGESLDENGQKQLVDRLQERFSEDSHPGEVHILADGEDSEEETIVLMMSFEDDISEEDAAELTKAIRSVVDELLEETYTSEGELESNGSEDSEENGYGDDE